MTVTFAEKLARMPGYQAGVPTGQAPEAIARWRTLMGATDPAKAEAGSLRKEFGESIERNATHGSDAPQTAAFELGYFFRGLEFSR